MTEFPKSQGDSKAPPSPPRWNFPLWYLPVALVLLWFWQSMIVQFAYKTVPYSEFKQRLRDGEIKECIVKENSVEGTLLPQGSDHRAAEQPQSAPTNSHLIQPKKIGPKETLFRTVRVEDPDLVGELEKANVTFRGERPNLLSQMLFAWIIPLGVMFLLWSFISRRIGRAGESILSFGKSRARLVMERETKVS